MDMYAYVRMMVNKKNKAIYTGVTSDVMKRTSERRNNLVPVFTKKYGCSLFVYYEQHEDIYEVIRREKQFNGRSGVPSFCVNLRKIVSQMLI